MFKENRNDIVYIYLKEIVIVPDVEEYLELFSNTDLIEKNEGYLIYLYR